MAKLKLLKPQRDFILKACYNLETLYDFENLNEREFKSNYGLSKEDLRYYVNQLKNEILTTK